VHRKRGSLRDSSPFREYEDNITQESRLTGHLRFRLLEFYPLIYTPTVSPFARSFLFAPSALPLFIVTAAELHTSRKYYVHPVRDGGAAVSSQRLSAASKPGTDFEKTLRCLSTSLSFLQLRIGYAANYPDCANGFFDFFKVS